MGNFRTWCRRNYDERESRVDPDTRRLGERHRRHRLSRRLSHRKRTTEIWTGR